MVIVSKPLYSQDLVSEVRGSVDYERFIKYNFQKADTSISVYNIAFFARADAEEKNDSIPNTLQFWGHGREYFSIFGPITLNLHANSDSLSVFRTRMNNTFNYFQKEILKKRRLYEHVDVNIFKDFKFTCYMDRDIPKYAFWYRGVKYNITPESIEYLNIALSEYFK